MDVSKYVHQCIQMDDFFPTKGNFPALFLSVTEQKQWSTAEDDSYKYKSRSKRETESYQSLTSFLISN